MNDRELLELAAKAAGMKDWQWVESWGSMAEKRLQGGFYFDRYWNPLEDDGDSRRLEVELHMTVCQHERTVTAHVGREFLGQVDIKHCRHKATRLAVLLCAAEIGMKMNEH